MEFTSHKAGNFCWADLATSSTSGAKDFYAKLFGWEAQDMPAMGDMTYTMLNIKGKAAAALYPLIGQQKAMNVPPHWMTYIACDDIKLVCQNAVENGGSVMMEPADAGEFGIGAIIQDPEGTMIGLWQAGMHFGASWKNIHGAYSWFELGSHGNEAVIGFYEKVFGYTSNTEDMGEMKYTTFFKGDGPPVAGMYIMPEILKDVPSHWLVYFAVDSIDQAIAIVGAEKAEVLHPKQHVPGVGSFCVIKDPQGAVLGILEEERR